MTSIRTYDGKIYLCKTCGQPCFKSPEMGSEHFKEQWDGIFCQRYPLAGELLEMEWHPVTLATLRASYPDTYPHLTDAAAAG
ncbi:hypothetical protein OIU91_06160 [Streptomyces sp. NBC_01456]|uniref:hypothetical protein n=1 Tax=Streptomyces sp. NBC_01456 TaxID=2975868 RepID=UPI002E34CAD6|nr:hypothetical protein [Streptomyces sp. NBC_01456]